MRLTADSIEANFIRSFRPGEIHLRDSIVTTNLIISAEAIIHDWKPSAVSALSINDLGAVLALQPEIILLGTGAIQQFPPIETLTAIMHAGIAIEVMSTHAACSTYNVLMGERRAVVAALLVH